MMAYAPPRGERAMMMMMCFMKTVLQRFMSYTIISHTNEHAVRGRPILNDVERFRNGSSIHESIA